MNSRPNLLRSLAAAAACGALVAGLAAACAVAAAAETPQVTVRYSDPDISSTQGAEVLYSRLRDAASNVCRPLNGTDLAAQMRRRACEHKAIAEAVVKVNVPAVSGIYRARNGLPARGGLIARQIL